MKKTLIIFAMFLGVTAWADNHSDGSDCGCPHKKYAKAQSCSSGSCAKSCSKGSCDKSACSKGKCTAKAKKSKQSCCGTCGDDTAQMSQPEQESTQLAKSQESNQNTREEG